MRQSRVRANYYAVLSMKPHFWGRTIKTSLCVRVCECAYLHTPINMHAATTTTAAWKILACNSICKNSRRLLAAAPQVHMVNWICWPTSRKTERKNNKEKSVPGMIDLQIPCKHTCAVLCRLYDIDKYYDSFCSLYAKNKILNKIL